MKRGRRFWAPQGWTVFRIPTGWTVFEIPSTPWLHDIRPIRFLRLRLDERRGSVFPRQARARRAEAGKGGKGRGGPANAATGGDAAIARRSAAVVSASDCRPRAACPEDTSMASVSTAVYHVAGGDHCLHLLVLLLPPPQIVNLHMKTA